MDQNLKELLGASRSLIKKVWRDALDKKAILGPEKNLAAVLTNHPEFARFWENADTIGDSEAVTRDGINPFLHIHIHFAVEEQILRQEPPEIMAAYEKLEKQGIPRHEIIHKLGVCFTAELFRTLKEISRFNMENYKKALGEIA